MIKVEKIETWGFEHAIRGMRNSFASWSQSDSDFTHELPAIGERDLTLMKKLYKEGTSSRKYLRQIFVSMDITAPLYWWKQMDTYKVGVTANSESTMHCITSKKIKTTDFSFEHLIGNKDKKDTQFDVEINAEDYKNEVWKTIVHHPNYSVSNLGRVLSNKRNAILKGCVNSSGYKKVMLNNKNEYIHRLVAETFIPNIDDFPEVNHKDGNKWNNNVNNLEWVSKSQNAKHAFDLGLRNISGYTKYRVAKNAHRFSDTEVRNIWAMYNDGMTKQEIANTLGCYSSTICNILNGNKYREIEMTAYDLAKITVDSLNELRELYLETKDKRYWYAIIQLLPSSYNQLRTVTMNYENVVNIINQRRGHRLDEWNTFIDIMLDELPYLKGIME